MKTSFTSLVLAVLLIFQSATLLAPYDAFGAATTTDSCNCVAFRLDDVQDYFLSSAQMKVIDTFAQRNLTITIGIIANYFGEDKKLVDYINEKANSSDDGSMPAIEIANHGWNHEDFSLLSKDEQSSLLQKSNEKIKAVTGVIPTVFIAPYDGFNNDTKDAMVENGMRFASANTITDPPPYHFANPAIYELPENATTGDLNDANTAWLGRSHEETFREIQESMRNYGFAVVMMHPQEFSVRTGLKYQNKVDNAQIVELEQLIEQVQKEGLRIVPISKVIQDPKYVETPEFPLPSAIPPVIILSIPITLAIYLARKHGHKNTG